jgi:hypothetical protein
MTLMTALYATPVRSEEMSQHMHAVPSTAYAPAAMEGTYKPLLYARGPMFWLYAL